jgi:LysM domain
MTAPVGAPDPTDPAADPLPAGPEPPAVEAVPSHADPAPRPDEHAPPASAREIATAICPYLVSSHGAFRSAAPSRDHRCGALSPPAPQPADKQRRHCLASEHVECSIFRAAVTARQTALAAGADPERIAAADAARRPLPRTTPVLLEPPRLLDQAARLQLDRAPGQIALVALMVVAFAIVLLSRFSAGAPPAASPGPSFVAVLPSAAVTPRPSPAVRPSAAPSAAASAAPAPSFRTTYVVKKGDTLIGVATKFKTTAAKIRTLNGLKSSTLHVGQTLKIP